jgi:hypothetical protein
MKKVSRTTRKKPDHAMRPEYDFSRGVRGKYAARYFAGTNVIVLDPDVAEVFPTSDSVNDALRALAKIIRSLPKNRRRKKKTA